MDHRRYIDEILPVSLKYDNEGFGNNWTFQQDTYARLNSRMMPDEFSIFHRQPILIVCTTRFGMNLLNKLTGPKLTRKRP